MVSDIRRGSYAWTFSNDLCRSSFRFEVEVTTPHFQMDHLGDETVKESFLLQSEESMPKFPQTLFKKTSRSLHDSYTPAALLGTKSSRLGTFCSGGGRWNSLIYTNDDVVTWRSLLDDLHSIQRQIVHEVIESEDFAGAIHAADNSHHAAIKHPIERIHIVCIGRRTRSWDFMPPDIVRPVASTTIGCLLVVAHRIGMPFSEFRPDEGIIRASGSGRSFTTSLVRGLGLIVEYGTDGSDPVYKEDIDGGLRIPSRTVDMVCERCQIMKSFLQSKLMCGCLPFNICSRHPLWPSTLNLRTPKATVMENLNPIFSRLAFHDDEIEVMRKSLLSRSPGQRLPGLADILGLWIDWLPIGMSHINTIDNPFPISVTSMGKVPEARVVWRWHLRQHERSLSLVCKKILETYDAWEKAEPQRFYKHYQVQGNSWLDREIMEFFKAIFDETALYFGNKAFQSSSTDSFAVDYYEELVELHVKTNIHSLRQAEENIVRCQDVTEEISIPGSPTPYKGDPVFTERAYMYINNIPSLVEKMKEVDTREPDQQPSYEDAWWMLMLRQQAWNMGIKIVEPRGVKIPGEHFDSPARVFIL